MTWVVPVADSVEGKTISWDTHGRQDSWPLICNRGPRVPHQKTEGRASSKKATGQILHQTSEAIAQHRQLASMGSGIPYWYDEANTISIKSQPWEEVRDRLYVCVPPSPCLPPSPHIWQQRALSSSLAPPCHHRREGRVSFLTHTLVASHPTQRPAWIYNPLTSVRNI